MKKHKHKFFGGVLIVLGVLFIGYYLFGGLGRGFSNQSLTRLSTSDGEDAYYGDYDYATEEVGYGRGVATNTAYPATAPSPLPPEDALSSYMDPAELNIERQVISRGYLSLVVDEVERAVDDIRSIVESKNGFLDNASINEYGNDQKRGNVTLRIPSQHFETTFQSLKNIGINVLEESISSEDVTQQVVDLDARLDNLYSVEEQYVEVLDEADTVEDILKVRQVLDRTREEIEILEARKLYLSQQVSLSTIHVSLVSEAEVEVAGIVWNPLIAVKIGFNNLVSGLTGFVDAVIGFVLFLPILFVWFLLIYLILMILWRVVKYTRRKVFGTKVVNKSQATQNDDIVKVAKATRKTTKKVKKASK